MVNVAVFSSKGYDEEFFGKANTDAVNFVYLPQSCSAELIKPEYDYICVFVNDVVDEKVIDKCVECGIKGILSRCAGYDRVNVRYAISKSLTCARVPAYSPYAVAEMTVALLMATNRRINIANDRVKRGNFEIAGLVGMDINGKTVGILGTGKIGQIFANIMIGFGAKIACFDVFQNAEFGARPEVTYMTQDEVFACADIISIHSPLLASTHHVIRKENLDKMKNGVMIVNPSRGGLVNTDDLLDAIDSGKVRGAGLDVYEHEAGLFFNDVSASGEHTKDKILSRLLANDKVVVTSHQAFLTDEALDCIAETVMKNIKQLEAGDVAAVENRIKLEELQN